MEKHNSSPLNPYLLHIEGDMKKYLPMWTFFHQEGKYECSFKVTRISLYHQTVIFIKWFLYLNVFVYRTILPCFSFIPALRIFRMCHVILLSTCSDVWMFSYFHILLDILFCTQVSLANEILISMWLPNEIKHFYVKITKNIFWQLWKVTEMVPHASPSTNPKVYEGRWILTEWN